MKHFFNFVVCLLVIMYFGLACKNNPLSKFTNQYNCTIAGEPEPKTSEDYYNRASKHIEIFSGNGASSLDDCAFAALNEAIRLDPNNVKALRVRGYGYRQKKQYDLAVNDFDKAVQIEPKNEDNYALRRFLYEDWGKIDKALEDQTTILNLLLKNNPDDNKKLIKEFEKRAELFEKKEDYENAIKDHTDAIRLSPDSKLHFYLRAKAYEKKGDFENSAKDFTEIIRLDSEDEQNYYQRAEVYRKLGKNDLAEADMKKFNELMAEKDGRKTTSELTKTPNNSDSAKTVSGGVLNGKATNLVQPKYPPAARAVRAGGIVTVQVTVDENGDLVSATAVSGHALLRASAVQAARELKFNPTILSGQKVRVSGVIIYNFTAE